MAVSEIGTPLIDTIAGDPTSWAATFVYRDRPGLVTAHAMVRSMVDAQHFDAW